MPIHEARQFHSPTPVRGARGSVSRRGVLRGIGWLAASVAGVALPGGCHFVVPPTPMPASPRRIGYLFSGSRTANQPWIDALLDQLRTHGWVEGDNLTVEWRFADGRSELLASLAAELITSFS